MIENEDYKIKKENAGKGALLSSTLKVDDPNMKMFYRELFSSLVNPQKFDKFMEMKIKRGAKKL